ncbi:unnamed protein product, partial [Amoebophrya sp. A25]|eukprot:GSA25T00022589001.1
MALFTTARDNKSEPLALVQAGEKSARPFWNRNTRQITHTASPEKNSSLKSKVRSAKRNSILAHASFYADPPGTAAWRENLLERLNRRSIRSRAVSKDDAPEEERPRGRAPIPEKMPPRRSRSFSRTRQDLERLADGTASDAGSSATAEPSSCSAAHMSHFFCSA